MQKKSQKKQKRMMAFILSVGIVLSCMKCSAAEFSFKSINKSKHTISQLNALKAGKILASQTLYTADAPIVTPDKKIPHKVNDPEILNSDFPEESPTPICDTFEPFNRIVFIFNDKLDIFILKPVATFYNLIMPKPLNEGITNFFNNLGEIPTIINDFLQFNFYQMANDIWRFGINSTIGIGGLFDIATRMNLPYYNNDFGLTLANWGYKHSNYLVIPFLGSYTIRDGLIGLPVDYYLFSLYPYMDKDTRYALFILYAIDYRARMLRFQPVLEEAAVDKYSFVRNAAMQRRAYQIEENQHLSCKDRDALLKASE